MLCGCVAKERVQKVSIIVESVEWKVRDMSVTYFILYTLF